MDRRRFDKLARFAASHSSRRALFKALGGAAAVGTGGAVALALRGGSDHDSPGQALAPATPLAVVVPPAITLNSASGTPGQSGQATLSGFSPGESVEVPLKRERVVVTKEVQVSDDVSVRTHWVEHNETVSATLRRVRSTSRTPSSRSSLPSDWESGGCVIARRFAARPKCSSSARATKWRSERSSIDTHRESKHHEL